MKATSSGLFQHPGLRRFMVRMRAPIVVVVLLLLMPFVQAQWLAAGFAVSMLGEAIQIWCFASLDKNATLTVRGPYTMVRNPMYLGRFFILLGFLMLLGNGWLILAYTLFYWGYMQARVQREEAHLRPIFGASYEEYCAQVRRFVPGWPLARRPVAFWDWRLFSQNNAGRNLAVTLAVWAAIAAWALTRSS
jgi:protein-S-isoprenylcysteine O-methyltransferase Ste14